ncbi:MAG: biotin--[acetyl-CoA-carboxylase] ligase [Planctomycetota bacterium]
MSKPNELADWQDHLEKKLPQPILVRVYQETRSTQDIAKPFAPKMALIIADQQTAGRGRLGRSWSSTPGASVLMSVVWPNLGKTLTHDRVSLLSGLAVARAVENVLPASKARLKWPNDVILDDCKLAGVLIEAMSSAYVIGIGLNVTRKAITDPGIAQASTCLEEHGPTMDRLHVIEILVTELIQALSDSKTDEMLVQWRDRAALGQTQTFEQAGQQITGEILDLDPDHGLIVRRDTGEIVTLPAATTSVIK